MPALAIDSQPANAMAGLRLNAGSPAARRPTGPVRPSLAPIDRAALLRDVWSGQGRAATGPALSASLGRDAAALLPAYDPRQASSDFTAAGLLPDDRGVRLRLSHLVPRAPCGIGWLPGCGSCWTMSASTWCRRR